MEPQLVTQVQQRLQSESAALSAQTQAQDVKQEQVAIAEPAAQMQEKLVLDRRK